MLICFMDAVILHCSAKTLVKLSCVYRYLANSPVVSEHDIQGPSALSWDSFCPERCARNSGKGGREGCVCAVICPLKEKTV